MFDLVGDDWLSGMVRGWIRVDLVFEVGFVLGFLGFLFDWLVCFGLVRLANSNRKI